MDNIQACLVFLTNLGVSLDGINSRDVRDGHLKSILSLFFQLSRFKQQQKQQDRDRHNLRQTQNNYSGGGGDNSSVFNCISSSSTMQSSGSGSGSGIKHPVSNVSK